MKIWWALMFCIVLTITQTQSAAVSTTETLVVAKTDGEVSPTPSPSDATTEEPNAPIKMTEMFVRSEVTMRYAHTAVVTHVRNPASKAQEATFHVLLPDTAFISGLVMTLGDKSYKAYIKEKNEAKKVFSEAVSHGTGAAHVAAKARDSNHFTVSVNVEPKSVAIFNLTYEEMLVRCNGVYNHAINLHPGTLVPKLEVVVHIKESQKITTLRVPEMRTGNEIDATDKDAQNSKVVRSRNGDKEATITFTPDLEEQMRLIKIYKDKTREIGQQEGLLGQFVVQYDVERSNNGEILVNDGYFVHFLAPNTLPTLSKHVVFVLDTSISMIGRKVEQLKTAMDAILSNLNPNDYFSIVEFKSDYSVHQLNEADEPPPSPTRYYFSMQYNKELVSPAIASPENINKAKIIISRLRAIGGTNIYSALNVAIDLIHKFADNNKAAKNIAKTNSTEDKAVASSNEVENKLIINELEPLIIFLTDGDPTIGETSTSRIISQITEKNSGDMKASLYALAFGEDADRNFLRKLSLRNEGFMRHIYEAADAALQLRDFYRQVASPLLAHVKFTYPKEQIKEGTVSKNQFRMVYAGSEIVVAGELDDQTSELAPIISAFRGAEDGAWIPYEIRPKVPVSRVKEDYLPLERLWAYLSIKQLLDERDAADQSAANEPEKKALALALKYSFVTSLTSLVVVKPNETNAVNAEPADKIVPQQTNDQQFHNYGRGQGMRNRNFVSPYNRGYGYGSDEEDEDSSGNGRSNNNAVNLHIIGGMRNRGFARPNYRGHGFGSDEEENDSSDQNSFRISGRSHFRDYHTSSYKSGMRNRGFARPNYRGHGFGSDEEENDSSDQTSFRISGRSHFRDCHTSSYKSGMRNRGFARPNYRGHGFGSDEEENDSSDQTSFRISGRSHFRDCHTSSYKSGMRNRGFARPNYRGHGFGSDEEENDSSDQNSFRISGRLHFRDYHTSSYKSGMRNRGFARPNYRGHGFGSDEEEDDSSGPSVATTTQLSVTTEVPDAKKYHLENYSWALGLLNNSVNALVFWENETQILLELSKDINAPRSSGPEEACSNTPASAPGPATCVYITRCATAKNITVDDYRKSYCRVDNKYAGVCCPSNQIDATV